MASTVTIIVREGPFDESTKITVTRSSTGAALAVALSAVMPQVRAEWSDLIRAARAIQQMTSPRLPTFPPMTIPPVVVRPPVLRSPAELREALERWSASVAATLARMAARQSQAAGKPVEETPKE